MLLFYASEKVSERLNKNQMNDEFPEGGTNIKQ